MSAFIDDLHQFLILLKNQGETKDFSPEERDQAIHRSSLDLFNELRKIFESSAYVKSALRPFKKTATLSVDVDGLVTLPADYIQITNFESIDSGSEYEGEIVSDGEWADRKRDPILIPGNTEAICRETTTGLDVRPKALAQVNVFYLAKPTKAVWGYNLSVDQRDFVYDANTTTELDWLETEHNLILIGALGYLGIPLRDELLIRFEQLKKAKQ